MFEGIGTYLKKYREYVDSHSIDKERIAKIISSRLTTEIPASAITHTKKKISVSGGSVMKHSIFRVKESLLQDIQREFPHIKDIS